MPPPPLKGTLTLCRDFVPNPYWRRPCGDFCAQQFCKHWVHEKRTCIDADPAGCTYEVVEAHCNIHKDETV